MTDNPGGSSELDDLLADVDKDATLATDVPSEVKEILENQDCYQWEAITEAVFNTYGGERLTSPAALKREIEHERRNLRDAKEDKRDAEERIQRHSQRIAALEDRRDDLLDDRASKRDAIDAILDELRAQDIASIWPDHPRVEDLASRWYGGSQNSQQAFEDITERHEERDMNLPQSQFEQGVDRASGVEFASTSGENE